MSKLKPCPLCKSDAGEPRWFINEPSGFGIECSNSRCPAGFFGFSSKEEAIEIWQTRPIEDDLRKQLLELKQENRRLVIANALLKIKLLEVSSD